MMMVMNLLGGEFYAPLSFFSFHNFLLVYIAWQKQAMLSLIVFSVNLVCKKELNLMLRVSMTSSQGAVGLS